MFDSNFDILGAHANQLKDLCELRGNVPDKDQHTNFKIFNAYVDAYVLCPIIGYQYGRKGEMGNASEGNVGILSEQMVKRSRELQYIYQTIMLIDEDSEPDIENRIARAFNLSEKTEEDKERIEKNMKIYNAYFLGGVEIMHEEFVEQCIDEDAYINRIYDFTKKFNEEQDGEVLKDSINAMLNM